MSIKEVYKLYNLHLAELSKNEYDDLSSKSTNTMYFVTDDNSICSEIYLGDEKLFPIGLTEDIDYGQKDISMPDNSIIDLNGHTIIAKTLRANNITFKNGTIRMAGSGQTGNVLFENIHFESYDGNWKRFDYSSPNVGDVVAESLSFINCTFDTVGFGIGSVKKLYVSNCVFDNPSFVKQEVDMGDGTMNHTEMLKISNGSDVLESAYICGNTFRNSTTEDAIDLYSHGEHCVITGNVFDNCWMGLEIKYQSTEENASKVQQLKGTVISNNIFINNYTDAYPIRMDCKPYNYEDYSKPPLVSFYGNIFDNKNGNLNTCYVFSGATPCHITGDRVINNDNPNLKYVLLARQLPEDTSNISSEEPYVFHVHLSNCKIENAYLITLSNTSTLDNMKHYIFADNCQCNNLVIPVNTSADVHLSNCDIHTSLCAANRSLVLESAKAKWHISNCNIDGLRPIRGKAVITTSDLGSIDGTRIDTSEASLLTLIVSACVYKDCTPELISYEGSAFLNNIESENLINAPYVTYKDSQGLTDQAKAIARKNIGAVSVEDVDELKSDTYCLTQYETVETKVEVHVTDWQNGSYVSQTGAVVKNNSQVACAVLIDISSYNAKKMEYTQIAHTSSTGEQPAWYTILMDENENVLYKYRCPLGNDYTLMTIDVPTGTHYALFTFRMSEQSEFVCNLITEEKIGVKQPRIDLIEKKKSDSNPIRFTVKTLTFDGIEKDTNCILSLSKNYSYYGNPSPIILMGHGTNSYVSSTSWNRDLEEWYSYINFLNENGYSVFDVDNTEALHTGENVLDCGCPELLKSYREAFEWIKANYNVQDRCIVWGQSQGSFTAVNFSHMYPSLVKCLLIAGPRVPMEEEWGLYKNKFASKFGANSDEPYDVNLFRPFSIYDRIENEKIITPLPPSLWLIGGNDNIWLSQMNDVINALKNSGYYVEANVYDGQDHHTTTYAMTEAERVDILRFLKLFG